MEFFECIKSKLEKTLFIATNSIDILPLVKIGVVKYGIVLNTGDNAEQLVRESNIFQIDNSNSAITSVSDLPMLSGAKQYIQDNINNFDNVWLFRPYKWSDDFLLKNKCVLSNSYYKYLQISRKLHQDHSLYANGSESLREHIAFKEEYLSREFIITCPDLIPTSNRLIFSSTSTGCDGISSEITSHAVNNNLFLKSDKLIKGSIPLCQNAIIIGDKIIKYQPKISIVKTIQESLIYCGGDYLAAIEFVPEEVFEKISLITHHVGLTLSKMGYKGIINCDYIYNLEDGVILFIEVNPRYSACTFLLDNYFSSPKRINNSMCLMPSFLHTAAFINESTLPPIPSFNELCKPSSYIKLNFNSQDWVAFLNNAATKNDTTIFNTSIVQNPKFPVTLNPFEEEEL